MKKKIVNNLPIIFLLLLIIFYFQYSVTILWDSAHYMSYVNILEGVLPFSSWDVVRGPTFPFLIHIGNLLFGKTAQGLIINTFVYYLCMLLFAYKILCYSFERLNYSGKRKKILIFLIMLSIVFNPIIFGFYHSLLTEFVAITLAIISCYLAVIWLDTDYTSNKKKYIILSILFAIFTVFSWFLKQPYVSCSIFPLIISYIISIFQDKKIKKIVIRTSTVLLSIVCLVFSIGIWNNFLSKVGTDPDTDRNPSVSLGNLLIDGMFFTRVDTDNRIKDITYIDNNVNLSENEKNEIHKMIEEDTDYILINMYDREGTVFNSDYIISSDGNASSFSAVKYIVKCFFKYPLKVIDGYVTNYLSIIDIYSTSTENSINYSVSKKVDLTFSNEIIIIPTKPYYYGSSNIYYMLPEMEERVKNYEQINYSNKLLNYGMLILSRVFLIVFKLSFLLLPFLFILSVIMRIRKKKKSNDNKVLNVLVVLFGYGMLHLLLHTVTGAIIDRYAIPAFISTYLAIIMLVLYFISRKRKI